MRRIDKDINKLNNKIFKKENTYNHYKDDYNDAYNYWKNKNPNIANKIKKLVNKELSNIYDLKNQLDDLESIEKSIK